MGQRRYREGMEGVPGHVAAGKLLNRHSGNHRAAWDALEIFDLDTADAYLADPAKAALNKPSQAEQHEGICEVATMFAMTAVLADRERRREDEEHQTRVKRSREEKASGDDPAA